MSIQKTYLKNKPVCKVKFELPKENVGDASHVTVVGEFNNWDERALAMKKRKDGTFTATLDLPTGQAFQFRYLIDDNRWENDPQADDYCPNNLCGADNSVIVV